MGTNPTLAVPVKELLVFISIYFSVFASYKPGPHILPPDFYPVKDFWLIHLYLSILVTARAGSVPAWFRKLLS
jgi:hypothetical protein